MGEKVENNVAPAREPCGNVEPRPQGLTRADAAERLRRFGHNRIEKIRGRPPALRFFGNFTHLMALLLWVGGGIAFLAELPQLAIAIWSVNLINGFFSFWQEHKAEKAVEALQRLLPVHARVLRDGREVEIDAEELVPGDILLLAPGDPISASPSPGERSQATWRAGGFPGWKATSFFSD